MILKDKTAFITGGSRGIGYSVCKQFLQCGVRSLVYYSRSKSEHHAELEQIAAGHSAKVLHHKGSVDDEGELTGAITEFKNSEGTLDILVNNAGITRDKLIIGLTMEDWDEVINVNLRSNFIACRTAAKFMLKQRAGSIVNITSVVGIVGNPGQSNYAASKAGIIGFTKSLAKECAKRNVRVNALAPGLIRTDMSSFINEDFKQKLLEQIPLGRMGEPDEIAAPIVFLCSDMATYITGQVLVVSGGMGA